MDMKIAGLRLKRLRLNSMETLKEVAMDVGITVQSLSCYENGIRIPRDEVKVRLARHFNTTVNAIFFAEAVNK